MTFIKKYITSNKNVIFKEFNKNGVKSILFGFNNILKPGVILCGHIDVVDAKDPQFVSKIASGKLFGRGAIDMKGSVAVLLKLIKDYQKDEKSLSVLLSSDEESGGENGVKYVLTKIKPEFAIIAEESGFDITVKQKGKALLKISTKGVSGHGSKPDDSNNAIIKLLNIYSDIGRIVKNKLTNDETFNLGVISGGTANNVVPDSAFFELDFRFSTKFKYLEKIALLKKRIKNRAKLEVVTYSSPMDSGKNSNKYIQILKNILTDNFNIKPKLKKTEYCGDGRYFSDLNIPVIEFGPIGRGYHTDNEYADIKSLETYYQVLKLFIQKI